MNGSQLKSRVGADEQKLFVNVFVWIGTDAPRKPLEVLIVGNLIQKIEQPNVIDRNGVIVIDGKGMTLIPGLVEGHAHITFPDSWDFNIPPEEHTLIAMHGAKKLLDAGFTSAFSAASAKIRIDVVIRNEINAGRIHGPRLRAASPELTCPGGLGAGTVKGLHESDSFGIICVGAEEITKVCELLVQQGVDTIKVNISGEEYTQDGNDVTTTFSEEEVAAAIATCRKHNITCAAHCRGSESVRIAIKHGVDVLYHCEYADDESLALIASKKDSIFLGPAAGFLVRGGLYWDNSNKQPDKKAAVTAKTYKKLLNLEPNMRVVIGGDYGFPPTPQGENAFDLEVFVTWFGYTPIQALICATNFGGQLMGMPVGKIEPGYFADLLLVDGDPTEDVKILQNKDKIKVILQDGFIYKNII